MGSTIATAETEDRALDRKLSRLRDHAEAFARWPVGKKASILGQILKLLAARAEQWVTLGCRAKRIEPSSTTSGEEWLTGPGLTLRNLRLLIESLGDVERSGVPRTGKPFALPNGQWAVEVCPQSIADRILLPGVRAETRLLPGVDGSILATHQASFYQQLSPRGRVCLVLGAGNVGSIPVMDVLYKMFVEGKVCLLKMNPVNDYLGPLIEQAFAPLLERGFLELAYGGPQVGSYLVQHPIVDELHMTGSVHTHDAIVWGSDPAERTRRLSANAPAFTKPVSSELGNITPVMIVPGSYTDRELEALTEHVVGMLVFNAGCNCVSAKMLVTSRSWPQLPELIERLTAAFSRVPRRFAYYPGAVECYRKFTAGRRDLRESTSSADLPGSLPWGLICNLDPEEASELAFSEEPFCPVLSEVRLASPTWESFIPEATRFANQRLWGTLNAMFFTPHSLSNSIVTETLERAIAELRYGCVSINQWSALAYGLVTTPWGGHPSSSLLDIQSGHGWVHNTPMLERIEKAVVRGPLRSLIKPPWFPSHQSVHDLGRHLCAFEASRGLSALTKLGISALRS